MQIFRILLLQCLLLALSSALASEQVTLQLKWKHGFQFAGYYAAKELGYYQQAGLDVQITEAALPNSSAVTEVVSGRANFGVGTSSLLLARKEGKPVVVLAVIFQHSPNVFIVRQQAGLQSIHDLSGKRIMIRSSEGELLAYLKREGIPLDSIKPMETSFNLQDLIMGKADAVSAYSTSQPFVLNQRGFAYQMYSPRAAGIDFYGDNLFTTEQEIAEHPERVKAFRDASLRGWEYAMAHPDEIIQLIQRKYAHKNTSVSYQYEASQMKALMRIDLVPIGYMNSGRWQHMADTYAEIGMMPAHFSLLGFLYEANPKVDLTWLYTLLIAAFSLLATVATIAIYIHRINLRLAQSLAAGRKSELKLKVFSTAIDQSPTSVLIMGSDTIIQYVNPKFTQETGYSAAEVIGKTPKFLQLGMTEEQAYQEMWSHLQRGELWSGELVNRRKSGEEYWEEAHIGPVKDSEGIIRHYVAVLLDINERKHIHQQLAYSAHYDQLTKLPNRSLLFERATQALALVKRNQHKLALLFIDLDKFKPINDQYGHAIGDFLLEEAAKRMSNCLRDSDTVGRIGGDEFVVLLPELGSLDDASAVAEKIRDALNQPFLFAEKKLSISSCIGIALYPEHGEEILDLAKNADFAMYQAKSSGGNKVSIFQRGPSN